MTLTWKKDSNDAGFKKKKRRTMQAEDHFTFSVLAQTG